MKRIISLVLVIAMCLSLAACGNDKKAFEASKAAYDKVNVAYEIADQFGSDIYDVWKAAVYNVDEIKDDDVNYLVNTQGLYLTEEELRDAIAYTFVWFAHPEGWDEAPEEKKQDYYDNAGSVLRTMANYYKNEFMSFCVTCVTNAYIRSGKVDIAQAALDDAKVMMKDLSEKYSDYEHYPNLKGYYTTTKSFFDFCQNPTGSFDQYTNTLNDYKNEARDYISDLDYIFED
ncbi:MAG: hypothetical protein U0N82_05620 [Oscillospiraceae bacterium]